MAFPLIVPFLAKGMNSFLQGQLESNREKKYVLEKSISMRAQANFVEARTEEEIRRYERNINDIENTFRARVGASGLRMTGSTLALLSQNQRTAQEDINTLRRAGQQEAKNIRTEAEDVLTYGYQKANNTAAKGMGGFVDDFSKGYSKYLDSLPPAASSRRLGSPSDA